MRMEYGTAVFRVELRPHVPPMGGYFHNLNQATLGICTYTLHAGILIPILVFAVELVAVAMTFAYGFLSIDGCRPAARGQHSPR